MSIHPEQHPLDGKLEPETKDCFNDRAPLYSIAISLKRIADAPSEAAARITELEAANGRLARLGRALERELDKGFACAERAEARCRALENASPAEPSGWRPMESAPRDRTYILARVAPRDGDDRWGYLSGRCFVIRHEERTQSGYDLGWSVFPGFGGVSDDWFEGWRPLPPTSEGGGA